MSHGLDIVQESLRTLPDWIVYVASVLTRLGDTWFVLVLVGGVYLFADRTPLPVAGYDRRDGAVALGLALAALAAVVGLKAAFAHPRPPGAGVPPELSLLPGRLRSAIAPLATADGYALPSGHALQSTVVYGTLALAAETGRRWRRVLAAGALVGIIAASRVLLGVHYLLDVLAGVAVGVVLLGATWHVAARRPGRALLIAVALALGAVLLAGFALQPLAILGGAIGARLAWGVVGGDVPARPTTPRETRRLVTGGVPLLGGVVGLTVAMEFAPEAVPAVVAGFLAAGLVVGALVALPAIASAPGTEAV